MHQKCSNYALIDLLFGLCKFICDAAPNSLKDPNANMKVKTSEEGIRVCSLVHTTSGVKKPCRILERGLK